MSASTHDLIQSNTKPYIMDGGLETTLIFENGYELPEFAAFPLLDQEEGRDILRDYYRRYIHVARKNGYGFILEGPTYRASSSWGRKLGYSPAELKRINTEAISFLIDLKNGFADESSPMLVSGCIGPQGVEPLILNRPTKPQYNSSHRRPLSSVGRFRRLLLSCRLFRMQQMVRTFRFYDQGTVSIHCIDRNKLELRERYYVIVNGAHNQLFSL